MKKQDFNVMEDIMDLLAKIDSTNNNQGKRFGIIVPFRNRAEHLSIFAPLMKRMLRGLANIYVVEQLDDKPFNRGKLINSAFIEFNKEFDYFAAHDVDMTLVNVNYSYCENPCHLATEVEQFGYTMPFTRYFGGVTLFPNKKFEEVNGFSNEYWHWGGEDCDLRRRFEAKNIQIESRQCRFKSLPHESNINYPMRMKNVERLKSPIDWNDGLSNCEYEIIHCDEMEHYTLLQVKL